MGWGPSLPLQADSEAWRTRGFPHIPVLRGGSSAPGRSPALTPPGRLCQGSKRGAGGRPELPPLLPPAFGHPLQPSFFSCVLRSWQAGRLQKRSGKRVLRSVVCQQHTTGSRGLPWWLCLCLLRAARLCCQDAAGLLARQSCCPPGAPRSPEPLEALVPLPAMGLPPHAPCWSLCHPAARMKT